MYFTLTIFLFSSFLPSLFFLSFPILTYISSVFRFYSLLPFFFQQNLPSSCPSLLSPWLPSFLQSNLPSSLSPVFPYCLHDIILSFLSSIHPSYTDCPSLLSSWLISFLLSNLPSIPSPVLPCCFPVFLPVILLFLTVLHPSPSFPPFMILTICSSWYLFSLYIYSWTNGSADKEKSCSSFTETDWIGDGEL